MTAYYGRTDFVQHMSSVDVIQQKTPDGVVLSTDISPSVGKHSGSRERYGVSQPNWRWLIRLGSQAGTTFSASRNWAYGAQGTAFSRRPNGPNWYEVTTTGQYSPGASFPDALSVSSLEVEQLALTRLYKKLRKSETRFQGAVFLGELRESIQMLKHPAKAFRNGIDKYFRTIDKRVRTVHNVPQLRKVVADTYLEASFGWSPFLSDIADISKEIKRLGENDQRQRLSSTVEQEDKYFDIQDQIQSFGTDHPCRMDRVVKTNVSCRFIIGKRVRVQALGVPKLLTQFGLIQSQIVPALWELTPWSFLLDYFTNIGDLVDATSTSTEDVLWTLKTVRRRKEWIYLLRPDGARFYGDYPTGTYEASVPAITVFAASRVDRTPMVGLPMPSFSLDLPGLGRKWLNMGALLASKTAAGTSYYKTLQRVSRPSRS